jgi:hypothetical protein
MLWRVRLMRIFLWFAGARLGGTLIGAKLYDRVVSLVRGAPHRLSP